MEEESKREGGTGGRGVRERGERVGKQGESKSKGE